MTYIVAQTSQKSYYPSGYVYWTNSNDVTSDSIYYHVLILTFFLQGVGGWDNRSINCTRDSARQPRNANVPNGSLDYDVYPANGTRDATSQLSSPVTSQSRATASLQAAIWLFNTERHPQHMWRTVTAIYTRFKAETWWKQSFNAARHPQQMWRTVTAADLHQTRSQDMVTAILQAAQQLWRAVTANIFSFSRS